MAQFSLKQTLADIGPGLPPGFSASKGIRSLFPPGTSYSITELNNYHFKWSSSLHAVGVTCNFTIELWGSGAYNLSGTANNVDFLDASYAIGFAFKFTPGGVGYGDIYNGTVGARNSNNFDQSGMNQWLNDNWPQALPSGVIADLKVEESPVSLIVKVVADLGAALFVGAIIMLTGHGGQWHKDPDGHWVLSS